MNSFFKTLVFLFFVTTVVAGFALPNIFTASVNVDPKPISVSRMENKMSGCLWSESDIIVPGGENFGRDPYIIVYPNADNTVSIAWLDRDKGQIHISLLNAKDSVIGEVKSKALARINTNLGGF
ncbi:MAG: hypothetical protein V2A54_00305, partial [Bacteroidota bacterium]